MLQLAIFIEKADSGRIWRWHTVGASVDRYLLVDTEIKDPRAGGKERVPGHKERGVLLGTEI